MLSIPSRSLDHPIINFNFEDLSRIPDYPNKNFIDAADFKNLKDGEVYMYWEKSQKIILQNMKAIFL